VSEVFGINPTDAGAVVLLTLVVLLILTGRLIPRRTHEDVLADRDNWRQAYLESEKARTVEHQQTGELLEMARLGGHILTALPTPGQTGEEEVAGGDRMDPTPRTRM
jgi:acyl CoA:acetate/3-ketoacid CoA transferase alpha subunit